MSPSGVMMRGIAVLTVILVLSPMLGGCLGTDLIPSMADDHLMRSPLGLTTYK